MKADTTRTTFRRERHFSSVRLQQGRVTLDADFNEQVDIGAHRDMTLARDVVGGSGAPDDGPAGFLVQTAARLSGLAVSGASRWAAGQGGTIVAGTAFTPQASGTTDDLLALAARNVSIVIGVGAGGRVVRTTNGGGAWTAAVVAGAPALRAIALTGATDAWAVGDNGKVYASNNDGQSWTAQTVTGVPETLRGVDAPSTNRPVAVGDAGRIIAFDGTNWVSRTSGVTVALNAVSFADGTSTGWAVGAGGTILKSTDNGTTWAAQSPGAVSVGLRAVEAETTSTAWAAGDDGTLLRTNNGGASWTVFNPPLALRRTDFTAVRALGGGSVVVAGDPWGLATVTSADAWTAMPLPTEARDLVVSPGRIWVEGVLVESEDPVRLLSQADSPGETTPAAGTYLAYLDVWERHVTAVERPDLREIALGGPDTASRTRTTWRLRLEPAGGIASCEQIAPGWTPAGSQSTGRLRARANPQQVASNECLVPTGGGYRRLENQHYRVEIHAGGAAGAATYKWSRDNGSVLGRLEGTTPNSKRIQVAVGGRSVADAFGDAKWVELSDERQALLGQPGTLHEVQSVDGDEIVLLTTPAAFTTFSGPATVRRWEDNVKVVPATTAWQALSDDGIEVAFSGGDYGSGDFWSFPARTLQPQVEWTRDADGTAQFERRHGTEHRFCPLALVTVTGNQTFTNVSDCRPIFTPLTDLLQAFIAGGEGQEAEAPVSGPVTLARVLEVGVTSGRRPVKNARVVFTVVDGNGAVNGLTSVPVTTNADGIASVAWSIQDDEFHQVSAELRDRNDVRVGPPLHFNARLEPRPPAASGGACTVTAAPGDDLQAAVEMLPDEGGELCLTAGRYELDRPLVVDQRDRVVITGRGPSTVLVSKFDVALYLRRCETATVRTLRVEAGIEPFDEIEVGVRGAITAQRSTDLTIHDCQASCPDRGGESPQQACIAFYPDPKGESRGTLRPGQRLVIERNRLEPGDGQFGAYLDSPWIAQVNRNHVVLVETGEEALRERLQASSDVLNSSMLTAIRPSATADTQEIVFADATFRINVDDDSLTLPLWRAFAERVSAEELRADPQKALRDFVLKLPDDDELRGPALEATDATRAIARAIDVHGNPEIVEVTGNVVEYAVQGIVAGGTSGGEDGETLFLAARVTVDDNAVQCRAMPNPDTQLTHLPDFQHSAVTVLNTRSASVTNTWARIDIGPFEPDDDDLIEAFKGARSAFPSDAVRVLGQIGPYGVVRQTHTTDFRTGVRFQPDNDTSEMIEQVLWLVAETMGDGASIAVTASPSVRQENNLTT